jgi:hypothetical protein
LEDPYYSRYYTADKHFSDRTLYTIHLFHKELLFVEEAIGFQFWLSDEIGNLSKKYPAEWNPNIQKQIAHTFYNRNLHYLYGAFELALSGLCDPSYNNIRTIYESILKMYYLWAYPLDTDNVHNDMVSPKRPKYGHNFLIQRLYTEATQQSMRNFFHEISAKAHASYTGVATTLYYSPKQVKDCLLSILLVSFYNVAAEVENQSLKPSILEDHVIEKIRSYLDRLRGILADENAMGTFFPDKPDLWEKLGIKLESGVDDGQKL